MAERLAVREARSCGTCCSLEDLGVHAERVGEAVEGFERGLT